MTTPVVVHGTPVGNPYGGDFGSSPSPVATSTIPSGNDTPWQKGEKQETRCRDPFFAVLGVANVAAIAIVCAVFSRDVITTEQISDFKYFPYLYTVFITGAASIVLSFLMLLLMMRIPTLLIKTSLIFSVVLTGAWAVFGFISGSLIVGIIGLVFFAIGICYAWAVWSRIPFASANLVTACAAIRANCGVTILSFLFAAMSFGWTLIWSLALLGVTEETFQCQDVNGTLRCDNPNYFYLFLLFLSFFFSHQIIQNTLHVIVAGVVGTWWFDPAAGSCCCSQAVLGSFIRAITTSFGSICFGSLVVAVIQALRQLANQARADGEGGVFACIAECILGCLESIIEYFNKWAFIYVGLYGYSYIEAGKNVFTLFQNRGWEAIIADDLVGNVLLLLSLVVGGISGVVGVILALTDFLNDTPGNTRLVAFILGLVVGLVICSVFMSSIGSGVNTVIVLFAEAPAEFQQNYPDLSSNMRAAWLGAFPGSV